MIAEEPTFRYWWTREEWAHDRTTGAYAKIIESLGGWKWRVDHPEIGIINEGTCTTLKGARAACRRTVRKEPRLAQQKPRVL